MIVDGIQHGNKQVVALLERWLEMAKRDKDLGFVAILGVREEEEIVGNYIGTVSMEAIAPRAMEEFASKIRKVTKLRMSPQRDFGLDASYVCYNACLQELSYDFFIWIAGAEMERVAENAPGPLKVGFWMGPTGDMALDNEPRIGMFKNVVTPAVSMVGAIEHRMAIYGRGRGYRLAEIVERFRGGQPVPMLNPSNHAMAFVDSRFCYDERPIVITLRETEYWIHRNSNFEAWKGFALYLRQCGETVIFVRDTACCDQPIDGFSTMPEASTDADIRLALYQRAKANLLVSNGPASMLLFSGAPWLMLSRRDNESKFPPERADWWVKYGMPEERYPWCRADQREVFTADSFDEIMTAWREYRGELQWRSPSRSLQISA